MSKNNSDFDDAIVEFAAMRRFPTLIMSNSTFAWLTAYYKSHDDYWLFVESSDYQAQRIAELSGKPVLCTDTNKMYNQ